MATGCEVNFISRDAANKVGVKLLVTGLRKAHGLRYENICWTLDFSKYSVGEPINCIGAKCVSYRRLHQPTISIAGIPLRANAFI